MKIAFDSAPIFDEKCQAVKFAGQIMDGRSAGRLIICKVPKKTLTERFGLLDPEPAFLLDCILAVWGEITRLAARKAMLGNYRPIIIPEELSSASEQSQCYATNPAATGLIVPPSCLAPSGSPAGIAGIE